jgi:lipopolysaccharide/colanic/teichoic acid biosynthesis glycosyltransferase
MYKKYFKRLLDCIMALIGLIVLSPLMFIIAVLIRIKLGSPVIFKQPRPGLNEGIFTLYKFRTMIDERDQNGELLPDERRLTAFGRWLRSTSFDELPELWNILKGDMSFVGPRPLLVDYLPFYNEKQRKRHRVRPGLTGLAQVSGRNALAWEERFALDVQYVDSVSFLGDLSIMVRTVLAVLRREGISSESSVTMEAFKPTSNASK